jgi:hypothetical protein
MCSGDFAAKAGWFQKPDKVPDRGVRQEILLNLKTTEFGLTLNSNQIGKNIMPENIVKYLKRLLLFIFLLVIHYLFMFLPILEFFLLYLIIVKPKWFQNF